MTAPEQAPATVEGLDTLISILEYAVLARSAGVGTAERTRIAKQAIHDFCASRLAAPPAPPQEPVAWMRCDHIYEDGTGRPIGMDEPEFHWGKERPDDEGWSPLYFAPPSEPVELLTDEEAAWVVAQSSTYPEVYEKLQRAFAKKAGLLVKEAK